MPRSLRSAVFLAILVLGAYSQIVQALLIRESLVVFYGNEVSLGAFYSSWLLWITLGSLAMAHWRDRPWVQEALPALRVLLLLLPLLLVVQIPGLRTVRSAGRLPNPVRALGTAVPPPVPGHPPLGTGDRPGLSPGLQAAGPARAGGKQ